MMDISRTNTPDGSFDHQDGGSTAKMLALQQLQATVDANRNKLSEPWNSLPSEIILISTSEMLTAFKKLIILDLEGSIQRQLEQHMWHYCFKGPLQHFMKNDPALYHHYIEAGIGSYLGFIHDVGLHFDIPFVRNSQQGLHGTNSVPSRLMQHSPPKGAIYYILQNSLIRVGDLLRYRSSLNEALKMYEKAVYLCPRSGHPYNQMGSAQTLLDNNTIEGHLTAIYYYARAVSVSEPYVAAQHSLDALIVKIRSLQPNSKAEEFFQTFLQSIANPQPIVASHTTPSLVSVLSPLITNMSVSNLQLFRLIVIALWAWRRESSKSLLAVDSSSESIVLEIIAALFNSLLLAANAFADPCGFFGLSHLKILLDWLRVNSSLVNNTAFRTKLHVGNLCNFLNRLLILENKVCGMRSREIERIILSEEKRLLGFLPFCRTFDNLTIVMEEYDPRSAWVRIYRILKCADSLSEARLSFIQRQGASGFFAEYIIGTSAVGQNLSSQTARSGTAHRNVALQSIFNMSPETNYPSATSPVPALGNTEPEPALPISSQTTDMNTTRSPFRYALSPFASPYSVTSSTNDEEYDNTNIPNSYSPFGNVIGRSSDVSPIFGRSLTPSCANGNGAFQNNPEQDNNNFSSLFNSIWTPTQGSTEDRKGGDGWN